MRRIILAAWILAAGMTWGQTGQGNTSFEVASLKPAGPQSGRMSDGGPGSHDPERFTFSGADLRDLIFAAYPLENYREQVSGPGWIDTEKYDLAVKIPPGTTKDQFQTMLQNLLAERFKLVVHHETKQLSVYNLEVAKNGPKLKESLVSPGEVVPAPPSEARDRDGFPVLAPGRPGLASTYFVGPNGPQSRWRAQQQTLAAFARTLSRTSDAGRIVIDKTGLTGKYDFTLYFDIQRLDVLAAAVTDNSILTVVDAIEQQLGLRLVDARAPFDVVVVDAAQKVPTEN
jgi:uncharacterized protein (TIGR03435 family)